MKLRHTGIGAGLAVAALTLAACGGGGSGTSSSSSAAAPSAAESFEAGTTMEALNKAGSIKIGTKFDQPGFGLKGLDGKPAGFDVEVGKIIAGTLGIPEDKITWVETPSKNRETAIQNGEVDLVVATYTINDKRKESVSFAGPYYIAGQQLMVAKDNSKITKPEDLKTNTDQKVCSVAGSTPAENIKQYLGDPGQLVTFDIYDKCVDALGTGQVQVVTTDNVILLGYVGKSDGKYKMAGEKFTEEPYGIGIKKADVKFCEFIDKALADNEDAYKKAWADTAGAVEGAGDITLPKADACS